MACAEALAGGATLTGASGAVHVGQAAVSGSVTGARVAVGAAGLTFHIGVQPLSKIASASKTSPRWTTGRGRHIGGTLLRSF